MEIVAFVSPKLIVYGVAIGALVYLSTYFIMHVISVVMNKIAN